MEYSVQIPERTKGISFSNLSISERIKARKTAVLLFAYHVRDAFPNTRIIKRRQISTLAVIMEIPDQETVKSIEKKFNCRVDEHNRDHYAELSTRSEA